MTERTTVQIDGIDVPLKIIREKRNSIRISLGKKEAIMRLPSDLPPSEETKHKTRLIQWMHKQAKKREGLFGKYAQADYLDGDTLRVGSRQYLIKIEENTARKSSKGSLQDGTILLSLAAGMNRAHRSESIRSLLSRLVAADQLPVIRQRVYELNQRFFQKQIKDIKLKYTHSRWGSCSSAANLNFSTRLLFAPQDVIDYVIIHELAHLIEQNHSARFWAIVKKAMPDYQEKEAWLKEFGEKCNF